MYHLEKTNDVEDVLSRRTTWA